MGKMIQNYSLQNELGRGMYSTVYRAINMKTKQEVAIKMVKAEKFKQYPKLEEGTYNQINILTNLEPCPHIIKYYDMLKTVNNFYFVYEYCNGGTLEKLLKQRGALPEKTALTYFAQVLQAFKVLNKHNIMHRDLKPENLLLHDGMLKLADFGFCKPLENQDQISSTMIGSPIYMAPEVLKGEQYTIKTDIWSLGVVLFRMLYGFCPFESKNIGKLIMIIQQSEIAFPKEPRISPEVVKLLRRMITKNPALRADWNQIFCYEIRNGQLYRTQGIREKTPRSQMKKSSTITETTNTNSSGLHASQEQSSTLRFKQHTETEGSNLIYNPRQPYNSELRSTTHFRSKSPFRENLKKDLMMKNHQKSIDIMSLAIGLMNFEQEEALALAYMIIRNVERELHNIMESVRKELDNRSDEGLMRSFYSMVQTELAEIKGIMVQCRDELRNETSIAVELIEGRKKEILKKLVNTFNRDRNDNLVIITRVVDYITEQLVIRKQTYEKMSRQKLQFNIRSKIQGA